MSDANQKRTLQPLWIVSSFLCVIFIAGLYWLFAECATQHYGDERASSIGSLQQGLAAVFAGMAFVGVLWTLNFQYKALIQSREDAQRNEEKQDKRFQEQLKSQKELHDQQLEEQRVRLERQESLQNVQIFEAGFTVRWQNFLQLILTQGGR